MMDEEYNKNNEEINNDFNEYQELLKKQEMKLKTITKAQTSNDFYLLIDELCGTDLSS